MTSCIFNFSLPYEGGRLAPDTIEFFRGDDNELVEPREWAVVTGTLYTDKKHGGQPVSIRWDDIEDLRKRMGGNGGCSPVSITALRGR